jgi:hypothetical protein
MHATLPTFARSRGDLAISLSLVGLERMLGTA